VRIVSVEKLEDCLDGGSVHRYRFETPWTRESILALNSLGKVEYFADFPRPLFRLRTAQGMSIQGICGEDLCRVIFPREKSAEIRLAWEALFC
jgi:hypothetical protein